MVTLELTRTMLRERQGIGARYDAMQAPVETLSWARLGTAYFARVLNKLSDDELGAPSLVPGWTRRHVVAQVGYQARALTRLTEWAASGRQRAMYESDVARITEIENGSTLSSPALRGLFRHAAVHLDVEWRDLPGPAWEKPLALPDGRLITARDTGWLRAREVWLRAVDLDAGGSFFDMPPVFLDVLLKECISRWSSVPFRLLPTDRAVTRPASNGKFVSGHTADLARWLTGRGARRLAWSGTLPAMPAPDPKHEAF
jgi:maleylpyruvate isomerase